MKPSLVLLLPFLMVLLRASSLAAENDLDKANKLFAQGKYEEALRHHISFHDNILKTQPAMYGVRLSFALSDWMELGKKYPKALTALKDIRDKKTARLAGGEEDRPLFHDVRAINDHLSEQAATVKLFKTIDARNTKFAGEIYDIAEGDLVQAKEYSLAKKYMGDPAGALEDAKKQYDHGMKFVGSGPKADPASQRAFQNIFARRVIALIIILQNTGDEATAKALQAQALKIVDDQRIRNALGT